MRGRYGMVLAGLVALLCLAPPAAPLAAPQAAVSAQQSAQRYFEVSPTLELVNSAQSQSIPEILPTASGDFVVGYLDGFWNYYGTPTFALYNGTTGARTAGPFDFNANTQWDTWANTTSRGSYTQVDGLGRIVRASWGFGFPNSVVSIKAMNPDGSVALGDTTVGTTPYQSSGAAITIGYNNSIQVVHYDGQVRLSTLNANGTWRFRNASLEAGSGAHFAPKLAWSPTTNLTVAAWSIRTTNIGKVVAAYPNGSQAWNYSWSMDGANMTIAVLPSGDTLVVYAVSDGLHAFRLDATGALAGPDVTIDRSAAGARAPRAALIGAEEVAVVYSDQGSGSDQDVVALAFNTTALQVTIPHVVIASDPASNVNPTVAVMRDGSMWVGWQNETTSYYANLSGVRVWPRWTGYQLSAPESAVTAVRGEVADLSFSLLSLVATATDYDFALAYSPYGGPTNWSGTVRDAGGAGPLAGTSLAPGASSSFLARVVPPVADPPGYGALVSILVYDHHRGGAPVSLRINVTVEAGHRFAVAPSDQNLSVKPGAADNLSFSVSVLGTIAEDSVPLTLASAPPTGWSASLAPTSVTGGPGESSPARLTVQVPAGALAGQSWCSRLRVMHPNDTFSLATAGFCVRVALVASPTLDPATAVVVVDPGAGAVSVWNLTNVGNAGSPIACSITAAGPLPAGWGFVVDPYSAPLAGGGKATLVLSISAPPLALGNTTLNLPIRATCEGSLEVGTALIAVEVRPVHSVLWNARGTVGDANATGGSTFSVSVENQGNVPEAVAATFADGPAGWTVHTVLLVDDAPASEVPAHGAGTLAISVQAPARAAAGTYRVTLNLTAGGLPSQGVAFDVRIAKAYGLQASFSAGPLQVGPQGAFRVVALLNHTANTADTYTLRIVFDTSEAFGWHALYSGPSGNGSEVRGSLAFAAFESGVLEVNFTAPREPPYGQIPYRVNISSARGPSVEYRGAINIVLPDLTVSAEGLPAGKAGHFEFSVKVTASNHGDAPAPNSTVVIMIDGREVAVGTLAALGPAEAGVGLLNITIDLAEGNHTLEVFIDPAGRPGGSTVYGQVFERNETNNHFAAAFPIQANPSGPGPAPQQTVETEKGSPAGFLILGALIGGTLFYGALRVKMRRREE